MSFGEFARYLDETEKKAQERALSEGKSLEEAKKIAEQERMASGSAVISALGRSTAWGITGAAVGSVVPVVAPLLEGLSGLLEELSPLSSIRNHHWEKQQKIMFQF